MSDPNQVTLFRHPITTIWTLSRLSCQFLASVIRVLGSKSVIIPVIASVVLLAVVTPVREITWFCTWWLLMGVASSIGLGTGLHTFVLYLLPHVAAVVTARIKCNGMVPQFLPNRYTFEYFGECPTQTSRSNSIIDLVWAFQFQAILWGAGSAIGELPPYFIAREASQTKTKLGRESVGDSITDQDVEEKQTLNQLARTQGVQDSSEEVKEFIIDSLMKYGFVTILILASIPNPFFDLAGLACGHYGIPLATFFSATFIGKSFIKVHVQIVMVLIMLSEQFLQTVLSTVDQYYPKLHVHIENFVQFQKQRLFDKSPTDESLIIRVWNILIVLMIAYFIMSIINTLVQRRLLKQQLQDLRF